MKKTAFILILLSLLVACKNDKKQDKTTGKTELEVKTIQLDSTNLPICRNIHCPKIEVKLLQLEGGSDFAENINKKTKEALIKIFHIKEDQPTPKDLKSSLTELAEDYNRYKSDDPESAGEYEATAEQELKSQNDKTWVVRTTYYLYTAGAHGYGATVFQNFDTETGRLLSTEDLLSDAKSFSDYVEKKFRLQYEIPPNADINSTGFFFPDNQFVLPKNIAVTDKEVVLLYNPYEVASYAQGQLRFVFPKDQVKQWFNY